ncbi:MAG: hemolysin III family protein [Alphaproteobacteria bacterium]|nr:hemolysin III family protein [Alphaproteobacteria bacterium]
MERARYTRIEIAVDSFVHGIGFALAVVGSTFLILEAANGQSKHVAAALIYMSGLIAMLTASALYNMSGNGWFKRFARRMDHAAIFVMIAGSYTPFALLSIGGSLGIGLLAAVWTGALAGAVWKIAWPHRGERFAPLLYLALGWVVVLFFDELYAAMSGLGLVLLVGGGIAYSIGVIFYRWQHLPFHNVIWHVFVLIGAGAHYAVVIAEVMRPVPLMAGS